MTQLLPSLAEPSVNGFRSNMNAAGLQPDILLTIFQFLQAMQRCRTLSPWSDTWQWTNVSYVCTHWRRVALEDPRLWSHIEVRERGTGVELFLERSKKAPLSLSANITCRSQGRVQTILKNMDRMQNLSLSPNIMVGKRVLDILENHAAPLLERFEMSYVSKEGRNRLPNRLFAGHHPSLRELKLLNCEFSWNLPRLETLVHLQIFNILPECGQCPSLPELTSIFAKMPNLENLHVAGIIPPSPPGMDIGDRVSLPRLSKIGLGLPMNQCIEFLDYIPYPATSSISIFSAPTLVDTPTDTIRVMHRTLNPKRNIKGQPSVQYLKLTCPVSTGGSFNIDAWHHPGSCAKMPPTSTYVHLSISMQYGAEEPWDDPTRSEFWNNLPLEGLNCLDIVGFDFPKSTWMDLVGHLGQLTILKMTVLRKDGATTILEVLTSTCSGVQDANPPQDSSQLYFPALRGLSITDWHFEPASESGVQSEEDDMQSEDGNMQTSELWKQLVACLRMRKKIGAGIETIAIDSCDYLYESGVQELLEVVPHVTWHRQEYVAKSEDRD